MEDMIWLYALPKPNLPRGLPVILGGDRLRMHWHAPYTGAPTMLGIVNRWNWLLASDGSWSNKRRRNVPTMLKL